MKSARRINLRTIGDQGYAGSSTLWTIVAVLAIIALIIWIVSAI